MLSRMHTELNELLIIVRETATHNAGMSLDPITPRAESAVAEHHRKELRKRELMERYELSEFPISRRDR